MKLLIKNAQVYAEGHLAEMDVLVEGERIEAVGPGLPDAGARMVDGTGCVLSPGFYDLHVHLRTPGFEKKETMATGTAAAAAGGFTTVCAMPNLAPVPCDLQSLAPQLRAIQQGAAVRVLPYGALTVDEKGTCPADTEVMAEFCCGFSDDGYGVQDEDMMRRVMEKVAAAGSFVAAHCEVEALLPPGGTCVQAGSGFAARHGYIGHSNESEWREVERDIRLAEETGCRLHICHTSCRESLQLVREAQKRGLPVSCEVTPHNLLLGCDDIMEDDGRFKMNPPLRDAADVEAAVQALCDGTAACVATDHAPHTAEEKAGGFAHSLNGVVGLETAFPALYTHLVLPGRLPLETLLARLTAGPAGVLGEAVPEIAPGAEASLVLLELATERQVRPEVFKSMGRATPFAGQMLRGWPILTLYRGQIVYEAPIPNLIQVN